MGTAILFILVLDLLFAGVPAGCLAGMLSSIFLIAFFLNDCPCRRWRSSCSRVAELHPCSQSRSSFSPRPHVDRRRRQSELSAFAIATVGPFSRRCLALASVLACMLFFAAPVGSSLRHRWIAIGQIAIARHAPGGVFQRNLPRASSPIGNSSHSDSTSIRHWWSMRRATDVSGRRMFLAGVILGILAGLMLDAANSTSCAHSKGLPSEPGADFWRDCRRSEGSRMGPVPESFINHRVSMAGVFFTPNRGSRGRPAVYSIFIAIIHTYRDMGPNGRYQLDAARRDSPRQPGGNLKRRLCRGILFLS